MAETGGAAERPVMLVRRLAHVRWLLFGAAALLALLWLAGIMTAAAAALVGLGLVVIAALAPTPTVSPAPAEPASRIAVRWPDTGMKLFAEALPAQCFILDLRGIVRYANRRAFAAFPIKPGEPLTHRLRVPLLLAAFDRVAKGALPRRSSSPSGSRWSAGLRRPLHASTAAGTEAS